MIRVPYEKIREQIKTKTDVSDEELDRRIKDKMHALSGLISKEGAAHIVANELGIKLFEPPKDGLKIKDVLVGMRNLVIAGKVQQKFPVTEFAVDNKQGKVGSFIIGDETGTMRVVLWNNQVDKLEKVNGESIVKIEGAYVKNNNGRIEAHLGERGSLILNPDGIKINEVKRDITQRKSIRDLNEGDRDLEIFGTIVQVYNPTFFEVCPICGKRARPKEDSFVCDEHHSINPDFSYVCNIFLDDGSESMRCVFFRQQAEKLMNKTKEQLLSYKENPDRFEAIKTELLGNMVRLQGRVVKNQMFDRLEFITNDVLKADPEEELKRLEKTGD